MCELPNSQTSKTSILKCLSVCMLLTLAGSQCPSSCTCALVGNNNDRSVVCQTTLTSFPVGVPANTAIFSLLPSVGQADNTIPTLQQSNFAGFQNLLRIQVRRSGVQNIQPSTFSLLSGLVSLDLTFNKISRLSRSSLAGLKNLQLLDVSENKGCQLDNDVFTDLLSLRTLRLGNIGLRELTGLLDSLQTLENLDLHGNSLYRLDSNTFALLQNLKHLDVSSNELYGMQYGLENQFKSLRSLQLEFNPWRCNCESEWTRRLPSKFTLPSTSGTLLILCLEPANLRLQHVANTNVSDLPCTPAQILTCSGPISAKQGDQISMSCDVKGDPFPDVTWVDPTGRNHSHDVMFHVTDTASLTVPASQFTQHHGKWTVVVESYNSSVTRTIDVTILIPTTTSTTSTTTTSTPTTRTSRPLSLSSTVFTPRTTAGKSPTSNGPLLTVPSYGQQTGHTTTAPITGRPGSPSGTQGAATAPQGNGPGSATTGHVNAPASSQSKPSYTRSPIPQGRASSAQISQVSNGVGDRTLIFAIVASALAGIAALVGMIIFAAAVYRVRNNRRVDDVRRDDRRHRDSRTSESGDRRASAMSAADVLMLIRSPKFSLTGASGSSALSSMTTLPGGWRVARGLSEY